MIVDASVCREHKIYDSSLSSVKRTLVMFQCVVNRLAINISDVYLTKCTSSHVHKLGHHHGPRSVKIYELFKIY